MSPSQKRKLKRKEKTMLNFKNYTIKENLGCLTPSQSDLFTSGHEKHRLTIEILNNESGEKFTYRTSYQYNPSATTYSENDGLLAVVMDADAYAGTKYFENFIAEFGYTDTKKAKKAFNGCKRAFEFFLKARINESKLAALRDLLDC